MRSPVFRSILSNVVAPLSGATHAASSSALRVPYGTWVWTCLGGSEPGRQLTSAATPVEDREASSHVTVVPSVAGAGRKNWGPGLVADAIVFGSPSGSCWAYAVHVQQ